MRWHVRGVMRYLSVCSGIEAATVAWQPLGWECLGLSEIEKFPNAVLQYHYPDIPNFGDMNDFKTWPDLRPDVLVGGTPCQSFSVAGLRAGMADPRGNLALVYLAIAERYRPRWLVWENVPGVLSSSEGRDFGSFIGAMVKLGYGCSWTVLDAQYFGVPQRRRRVFVVGHLGDWRDSAKVLFEPQSLRRDPPPSRETGQRTAASPTAGSNPNSNAAGRRREDDENLVAKSLRGNSGGIDREDMHTLIPDVAGALTDGGHGGGGLNGQDVYANRIIPIICPDVANPLTRRMRKGFNTTLDEGQTPIVSFNWQNGCGYGEANDGLGIGIDQAGPQSTSQVQAIAIRTANTGANGHGVADEVAHTIDGAQGQAVAFGLRSDAGRSGEATKDSKDAEGRMRKRDAGFNVYEELCPTIEAGAAHTVAFAQNQRDEVRLMDKAGALAAEPGMKQQTYVAFTASAQANSYAWESDINPALNAQVPNDTSNIQYGVRSGMQVRRLTPLECERLQGFPDGYTKIPKCSDSGRYRALGNSMAVPVMAWIGRRIQEVDGET